MIAHPKAANILIDCSTVPDSSWCWRPEWYSGSDSVYGLLAKFGSLNVLTTRELCELFVDRNTDERRGKPHFPVVDFRYVRNFRISRLANLLRLDSERVRLGFVESLFPNATSTASPDLVWCPACAKHGFHSPTFQLNFSNACPLHGRALLRRCTWCSSPLPYRLSPTLRGNLFSCPRCNTDFAPTLRSPGSALEIGARATTLFTDYSELVRFSDQLPTLINACKALVGRPYMPLHIGKPDIFRRSASFRQFAADVLIQVSHQNSGDTQVNLEPLEPSFTFIEQSRAGERLNTPMPTHAVKSVATQTDMKLEDAWTVYRCVRRHLWRHHVCRHRSCTRLAMKTLWWDLEGEKTVSFCKVALAFIRWRMQWEGRRIPSALAASNRGIVFYGLLGWISKDAPIASTYWRPAFETWLNAHLLAAACWDSFAGWLAASTTHEHKHALRWSVKESETFAKRHWACSGRGNSIEPGFLFMEPLPATSCLPVDSLEFKYTRMHRRETELALALLKR